MGGGKIFYEEHHSLTSRTGSRHSTTDGRAVCPPRPVFFCLAGPYKTIWPKKSRTVLIYAYLCHFCIFQHQAPAYGLCDKFITSHVYVPGKYQQDKCASASVPAGQLLAKIILQDINAFGSDLKASSLVCLSLN